ncbi:MAG: outer membrane protein assembly factor BamA [Deltaproteobacteria bacterium GWA2_38_16]|nr:MAG: outer membrane protein assembly factor BamA [Deltaproteobacteria bacterium GWA2_38_16]OGQ03835.1 MAG: outer membrane protein assembly factor BamA [Deltaproteobacteria bacterium RIFCSPHIGHO2_02_FULL_38_15]OGQ31507.1 MAG: outer membrane protein assembly factor BamA [Deltaproteobacteria bacterium RIFCSPLOWO2_01_FULL_38_9]OGQ63924.1 MAG: outer membrane protein assembly factor BamA [Deltaproteobacteria bacterium RIFCSPLOWO2_12_FULL_38_8]HBQ20880.1 outer membrane protein assembly factor BamA 
MLLNKKVFIFSLLVFSLHSPLYAEQIIHRVSIEGNRRVEKDAILNQIKTKPRTPYSQDQVKSSIQSIYNLGFFDNIEVDLVSEKEGVHLIYRVWEKPAIRKIEYEGYKKLDLSDIRAVVELKEYSILNLHKITETKEKILKLYEQKGFFLAQVKHTITEDKKDNEVDLTFHIDELDKVKVRKINFIGNHAFSDDELKGFMATKESGVFSWLTKSDNFQEEVLKGDMGNIAYFYNIKGYVKIKVDPPVVTISPDKKWIYIVVPLQEGELYNIGNIDYAGELIFSKDELKKERGIQSDALFNGDMLRQEVLRLADLYKDQGYAFANVNVQSSTRDKDKKVDLIFDFEKGQKVYFGNINVVGNTSTRDKVVRRELSIHEGDLYSETKLRKSIDRVRALGFFSEVTYTKPQGKSLDVVDLEVAVKERSTGALTVGAGWSSVDKFVANAQISHSNLFGRGQEVALNAQLSTGDNGTSTYSTSFTEPYTLDTLWSSGFDAYNVKTGTTNYDEIKTGGDVRIGHPIGEFMNTYLTYKLENTRLKEVTTTDDALIPSRRGITSAVVGTFIYDGRDDRQRPSKGFYETFSTELAGLGGDYHYSKNILRSRFYYPMFFNGVFRVNTELGGLLPTTNEAVPVGERFILGGVNTLRGYMPQSVGPLKQDKDGKSVLIGGDREWFTNIEYEIPLISSMGIKGVTFYDAGNAFDGLDMGRIRQDIGFGFRWFSPFGPLRVEVGFPVKPESGEKRQVVQFAITPPF